MKLKNFLKKYIYSAAASALTLVASAQADQGCYFIFYQPKAPKGLKDFSGNR
ncbi:MAG: cyclic lactone autoinducer peptide [Butyrivibrio sp.]|nr:cyclic lactone autoinducer peptide [Butyrivibrio sp.]